MAFMSCCLPYDVQSAVQMFSRAPPKPQVHSVFRLRTDTADAKQEGS